MGSVILGLIMSVAGFWLIWKTEWIVTNFGRINWAEEHLGTEGGTRIFYKLLGLIIIFFGFAVMTGLLKGMASAVFGSIFVRG